MNCVGCDYEIGLRDHGQIECIKGWADCETCGYCHGKGDVLPGAFAYENCPVCGGTGRVESEDGLTYCESCGEDGEDGELEQCPECGRLLCDRPCCWGDRAMRVCRDCDREARTA